MKDLQEIASTIGSLPVVLQALLAPVDQRCLTIRPEPGEWSVLEVIGHLVAADSGGFRYRIQAIADGQPEVAAFDPWAAINARDHAALSLSDLMSELIQERTASVRFVNDLSVADLSKIASYREHGDFAAADFVHEWPFHDQEHIQQILDILKANYLPHMSATMRRALASHDE